MNVDMAEQFDHTTTPQHNNNVDRHLFIERTATAMSASDDDDSLSGSDRSHDHDSDMDDTFENTGPDDQWTHIAHSSRGSKMYDGLSKRSLSSDEFNLHYNYADERLLAMAKEEVKHLLSAIRQKLRLNPEAKIGVVAAFAGAMPEEFLLKLFQWLKAGQWCLSVPDLL